MICSDNWHKYHESSDISQLLYVRNCATKESFNLPIISSKIKKEKERKKEKPLGFRACFHFQAAKFQLERLRFAFTANGKSEIQVENFSEQKTSR